MQYFALPGLFYVSGIVLQSLPLPCSEDADGSKLSAAGLVLLHPTNLEVLAWYQTWVECD